LNNYTKGLNVSCCGKTIKSVKSMTAGYFNLVVVSRKYVHTDNRIRICHNCKEQTWMSKIEYIKWLKNNGIDILKNFNDLEKLPKLAKHALSRTRRNLFCRICKCFIPAKASIKDSTCPLGKWEGA